MATVKYWLLPLLIWVLKGLDALVFCHLGDKFCAFLFAFLAHQAYSEKESIPKGKICSTGAKLFFWRQIPFQMEAETISTSVPLQKVHCILVP